MATMATGPMCARQSSACARSSGRRILASGKSRPTMDSAIAGRSRSRRQSERLRLIERLRRSSAGKLVVLLALLVVLPIAWVRHDLVLAALAYFLMIATVLWHVLALRSELGRFTRQAREVKHRRGGPQFGEVNRLTEFAPLARGLDSMVRSLEHSRRAVREAAEETAHALKSPIGAVAQSIEPLRERVGADDRDGRRAIAIIDGSVERLGNLVPVVREL